MKKQFKGLKNMNKAFRISLMAISLVLISCEIPENLNDNPNEITVSDVDANLFLNCLLYTSPSPRDGLLSRMPSSA